MVATELHVRVHPCVDTDHVVVKLPVESLERGGGREREREKKREREKERERQREREKKKKNPGIEKE